MEKLLEPTVPLPSIADDAKSKESGAQSQHETDTSSPVLQSPKSKPKIPEFKSQKQTPLRRYRRFWLNYEPIEKFTLFLVCFTAIYSIGFLYELYLSNRAYVYVSPFYVEGIEANSKPKIKLSINNAGRTPAHSARIYTSIEFVKYPIDKNATFASIPKDMAAPPQTTIFPSTPVGAPVIAPKALLDSSIKLIKQDNVARIAVWGTIIYWDVFHFQHHTNFCFLYSENGGEVEYCPVHNDTS